MLIFLAVLCACLGAYVGKLMAMTVRFLPQILLEERIEEDNGAQVPRDLFTLFFQIPKCLSCKKPISWWHNTPIIGYFLAKGKSPCCHKDLGLQSIFLEVGMALLFAITAIVTDSIPVFLFITLISSLLICCFITDFEYGILPDQFTLSLLWIGLIGSIFHFFIGPKEAIIGAVAGYGFFWLTNEIYRFYRNEEGMFPGDFKLNAALGACLGIQQLISVLVVALVLVVAVTIIKYIYAKKAPLAVFIRQEVAYGCYVSVVALSVIFLKLLKIF